METDNKNDFCQDYTVSFHQNACWKMEKFHFHDTYEVLLCLTDGGEFFVGESAYPIRRGGLLVFNSMDLHRSAGLPGAEQASYDRYVAHFIPEYAAGLSTPQTDLLRCFEHPVGSYAGAAQLNENQTQRLCALFRQAGQAQQAPRQGYGADLRRQIAFAELLLYVNSLYQRVDSQGATAQTDSFRKVQPILAYVQQNYQNRITLDGIAQQFYMSKYYLCHVFKDVTGFGLNEYIINLRILKARELLRQNLSVQQVGEIVGFSNNSHFIRTFKAMVGVSPGQYSHRYR